MLLNNLHKKQKYFKRFMGLSKNRFDHLAGKLGPVWECYERKRLSQKKRKRKIGGGMNYKLKGIREKLSVVLLYYKLYVTQEFLGELFGGLNQSNISRLINRMTPILLEVADPLLHQILEEKSGARINSLEEIFKLHPDIKEVIIDGTDSPIQRPKDKDERKDYYSGKRKKHTIKHEVVSTAKRRIIHVSNLYPGKVHDKTIIDSERTVEKIPENISILGDLGYYGLQKEYSCRKIILPPKKPKGGSLSPVEKFIRRLFNKRRVVIEHAIGDLKKFNILQQIFRGRKNSFNKIFKAICALHNFKLNTAHNGI